MGKGANGQSDLQGRSVIGPRLHCQRPLRRKATDSS